MKTKRLLKAVLVASAVALAIIGSPSRLTHAQQPTLREWAIVPEATLRYNPQGWSLKANQNTLESRLYPGCAISQNVGSGIPEDWRITRDTIRLGGHRVARAQFFNKRGQIQFATYSYLTPGLGYLSGEGVLLSRPRALTQWTACRNAAEGVLATAKAR